MDQVKRYLTGIFEALEFQQKSIFELWASTTALRNSLEQYDPEFSDLYLREYQEVISQESFAQAHAAALRGIEDVVSALNKLDSPKTARATA